VDQQESTELLVRWRQYPMLIWATIIFLAVGTTSPPLVRAEQTEKPKPCSAAEYRQFDFWLGSWNVSNPDGKQVGTNRIESILGGCALAEHWQGGQGSAGTSLNFYDASRQVWHQTWTDNQGAPLFLEGGLRKGKMVLEGDSLSQRQPGKTIRNRITWSKLEEGRVRQLWDVSDDGGKTWKSVFDGMYARIE